MHNRVFFETRLVMNNSVVKNYNRVSTVSVMHNHIHDADIEKFINANFTIRMKASGRPVFLDSDNREVTLSVRILPENSEQGKKAIQDYITDIEAQNEHNSNLSVEIRDLLNSMTREEILAKLKA